MKNGTISTTKAAEVIGCSPRQVRNLITGGLLPAESIAVPSGFVYRLLLKDARDFAKKNPPGVRSGWPRGRSRKEVAREV